MEEVRFEPGAVVYTEGFRVVNLGTVTTNIRMYITRDEKIDPIEFAKAFEIYITKDPSGSEQSEELTSFEGSLAVDGSTDLYYLVIMMKDTADNTFQNACYSGIGITVYAVQGNVPIS